MAQNSSKFIILGENPGLNTFAEKLSNEALEAQASVIRWDRMCVKTKDQFEEQMKMYWHGCLVIGLLDAIREKGWVEAIGEEYLNSETQKFFGSFDMVMTPEAWIHEIQTNIEKYRKRKMIGYMYFTLILIFSQNIRNTSSPFCNIGRHSIIVSHGSVRGFSFRNNYIDRINFCIKMPQN